LLELINEKDTKLQITYFFLKLFSFLFEIS